MFFVCKRSVGDGDILLHIDPKFFLTIAALLLHSGWAAQPWVTVGLKSSVCRWLSIRHLVPNWLQLQLELELTQAVCSAWLYNCLTCTCFLWAYASSTSTGQGDIPRSTTGFTYFAVLPVIYTGASLDWRLGRESICCKKSGNLFNDPRIYIYIYIM